MGHSHTHTEHVSHSKAFGIGIALNVAFVVIEAAYGWIANSSALLADAGHNFGDVFSLVFAWGAAWIATRKPDKKYTYGFKRTTILVSILNAVLLFLAAGIILYHAFNQLRDNSMVNSDTIIWVALVGIVINTATALLFMKGQKEDLNIKGAFLHMAADAGVSLGVVVAGLLIRWTGLYWIDPVVSFIIVIVIVWSTWKLFSESLRLALDAVPENIDQDKVKEYLLNIEGVEEVHDLHIWALGTTKTALTAHLVMPGGASDELLVKVRHDLAREHQIDHVTIQVEHALQQDAFRPHCT
ncbi:cation diffusion facilitator family transporter [Fulvivirga sedimenti]|uniref:Cation diffusion facilitator family transporter n=1 Tax=Fulvivirga sedimenti TaxID=2879465 RepID=A0A9X1HXM5_9BACT|nr:cation diffusion facilitator family transporter [Fulvivirga sedimenti]MCA6078627.1 cation diffusion facilitator family transporter [Fulvivirga sedimenti]